MGEMISAFEREQLQKLLWQLGDNAETEYSVMTGEQAIALLTYIDNLEAIAEAAEEYVPSICREMYGVDAPCDICRKEARKRWNVCQALIEYKE